MAQLFDYAKSHSLRELRHLPFNPRLISPRRRCQLQRPARTFSDRSAKAQERKDSQDHDDCTDDINNTIHSVTPIGWPAWRGAR